MAKTRPPKNSDASGPAVIFLKLLFPLHLDCDTVNQETKNQVIEEIHQTCKDVGFFYLTGHGVEESTLDKIFTAVKDFFALPMETKNSMNIHNSRSYAGYVETSRYC